MRIRDILHASAMGLLGFVIVAALSGREALGAAVVADLGSTFIGPDGSDRSPVDFWRQSVWWLNSAEPDAPFQSDDEILEFLRTAEVIEEKPIGKGINGSRRLLLEKHGVRARAAFRETDRKIINAFVKGRSYPAFRDSYLFEPAAYQLARLLGIHSIPPATLRRIGGRDGSLQIWVENAREEEETVRPIRPPSIAAWVRQVRDMVLFDNLIFNTDRNTGNMLITQNYRLMMIDHTRAFQPKAGLVEPERLTHVNRETWERLRNLTHEEIADAVRPFLTPDEIAMLQVRRRMVIEHVEKLIEARGEDVVVF